MMFCPVAGALVLEDLKALPEQASTAQKETVKVSDRASVILADACQGGKPGRRAVGW